MLNILVININTNIFNYIKREIYKLNLYPYGSIELSPKKLQLPVNAVFEKAGIHRLPYVGLRIGSILSLDCEPPNCFIKRLHAATPSCFFALAISFLSKRRNTMNK